MILRIVSEGIAVSSTKMRVGLTSLLVFGVVSAVVSSASGGAGMVATAGAAPESATDARAVTVNTGSFDLNVRSAPSMTSQKIGTVANHSRVVITCYARGAEFVGGPYQLRTDLWNRLDSGGYVTDAMLDTGSNDPVVPPCATEASRPTSARATGRKAQVNPAKDGTDAWAALEKWFFVSGEQFYPAVTATPRDLAGSARSAGWTVVDDPQPRAIVVIPGGQLDAPPAGHIAWVDSTSKRSDGTYLTLTEMAGPGRGPGTWSARTVKAEKGLSFVLLP
ncbi:CHAP domain-containing protein [Mycolicibacterium cosmeticum]|uniref:CHAP domain-containing protein n=1 Tax=Mycolicibacterium cosmeticum TaxID=258533 RepID=W9AMZ8_MYCCO|nr:CHAP domain-containing protein [Mycolicibacterium cosmeticum]